MALLFCFMSSSDPATQQQHEFIHNYTAMNGRKKPTTGGRRSSDRGEKEKRRSCCSVL